MHKGFFLLAALSGFFAVTLGAFGSHGLKNMVTAELVDIFNLGVQYQFYHTFALIAAAFAGHWLKSRLVEWAGYLFLVGMALFSGSLYLYAFTGAKWLGPVTPLGGGCLMLGWMLLALSVWRNRVKELDD